MPAAALALLLLVALLRGGSYLPTAWALDDLGPLAIVAAQCLVGTLALGGALAWTGRLREAAAELRARPWPALQLATLQTVLPFVLIALALQHVPTGLASVLVCSAPLFATTLSGITNPADRPTGIQAVGLAVGIAGVALVVGLRAVGSVEQALAALALLVAAAAYASSGLVVRRHYRETPIVVAATMGVVPALPVIVVLALALQLPDGGLSGRTGAGLLILGLGATAIALCAFLSLIRRVGPIRALLVTYLNPAVAVLLGVAFNGESLSVAVIAGLGLVVLGVVLATRRDTRAVAGPAPVLD